MLEKTKELLRACKKAGYERVTIFVADKRVPDSARIRKTSTGWDIDEDGMFLNENTDEMKFCPKKTPGSLHGQYWGTGGRTTPFKVICAAPALFGECKGKRGAKWPKIWDIARSLGLSSGPGNGQGIAVDSSSVLNEGYYDLSELETGKVLQSIEV
jgi:hypothetical protein